MTTTQKIEALNKACKNSLGIQCYTDEHGWEIHSFKDNTPLDMGNHYPYFTGNTLKEVVDKAYDFVFNKQEKK